MFDMLVGCKKTVALRCGSSEIVGVISNYYEPFQLLKINNLLLPVELIEQIEVLDGDFSPPYSSRNSRASRKLRLV